MHALYAPESKTRSLVYSLDVRTKVAICLSMSFAVVFLTYPFALAFLGIMTLFYVLNLGRYKAIIVCYTAIALMWLIAIGIMRLMHAAIPMIPVTEPLKMMVPFMRTLIMINTVLALALSSRVQALLTALKSLKLPIWLYIPSAVMIRFIPSFIKDVRQIHETMRIRGYSLNPFFILRHPLTAVRLMAAPLIFRALRSSDDLGVAAELKGVGYGASMNSFRPSFFKKTDALMLLLAFAVLTGACFIQIKFGADTKGGFM